MENFVGCESQFCFEKGFKSLNHGSFGATPRSVMNLRFKLLEEAEATPDPWYRIAEKEGQRNYRSLLDENRSAISKYLNADVNEIVFVDNSSSGVNVILCSQTWNKGDKLLITNTAYPMVKQVALYLSRKFGVEIVQAPLIFPLKSNEDVIRPVKEAILQHGKSIKMACFSHIDSVPGFILPLKELIQICKQNDIKILIDGAHAIGQIPVDLKDLDPDYYVSNCHKWLFTSKGCAVLYVKKSLQNGVLPPIISGEFMENGFVPNFGYTGTRDYTPFLTVIEALKFRETFGEQKILRYNHDLAWFAGNHLAKKWNTRLIVPENMCGSMIDIELPVSTIQEANEIRKTILEKHNIYFVVYELQGKPFVRLSAQIYLRQLDFVEFGEILLQTIKEKSKL